jgi:ferredoxin-type protein NapG
MPVDRFEIDMGTAVWREEPCLRHPSQGEQDCRLCVEKCPIGLVAIELVQGQVQVNPHGCVGCGVCQTVCPTTPKSIVVIPRSAREPVG